jgi:septal ring factor EnvC (AmiA/AmiB activator)
MFGVNKKRQAKSVEEFVGGQDGEALSAAIDAADNQTTTPAPKRWFVAPAVTAGALLALLFVAFVEIGALKSEIAQLELRMKSQSADDLKVQVAALNAKVDESHREAAALKDDIARLEKDLAAMKSMDLRKQKAEIAEKKSAIEKKKPVKPARRKT